MPDTVLSASRYSGEKAEVASALIELTAWVGDIKTVNTPMAWREASDKGGGRQDRMTSKGLSKEVTFKQKD